MSKRVRFPGIEAIARQAEARRRSEAAAIRQLLAARRARLTGQDATSAPACPSEPLSYLPEPFAAPASI